MERIRLGRRNENGQGGGACGENFIGIGQRRRRKIHRRSLLGARTRKTRQTRFAG